MGKTVTKFIHSGDYIAEVEVTLIEDSNGWSPCMSLHDAKKLDTIRKALQDRKLKQAAQYGKIYKMMPVAV